VGNSRRFLNGDEVSEISRSDLGTGSQIEIMFPAGYRHSLRSNVKTSDVSFPNTLKIFQGKCVHTVNLVSESGLYKLILRAQRSGPEPSEFSRVSSGEGGDGRKPADASNTPAQRRPLPPHIPLGENGRRA
jgi:hypothetical protein